LNSVKRNGCLELSPLLVKESIQKESSISFLLSFGAVFYHTPCVKVYQNGRNMAPITSTTTQNPINNTRNTTGHLNVVSENTTYYSTAPGLYSSPTSPLTSSFPLSRNTTGHLNFVSYIKTDYSTAPELYSHLSSHVLFLLFFLYHLITHPTTSCPALSSSSVERECKVTQESKVKSMPRCLDFYYGEGS